MCIKCQAVTGVARNYLSLMIRTLNVQWSHVCVRQIRTYGQGVVPQIRKSQPTIWTIRECASERSVIIECSASQ